MRKMLWIASALALVSAAGCVGYDERIELNPDGSGVVRMHMSVSEQALGPFTRQKIEKEDDLWPMPKKELIDDFEKQGFKVQSVRAESAGGIRHFYIVVEFKSLADLEKSDLFGGRKASLKQEGGRYLYRSEIAVNENTLDRTTGPKTPSPAEGPKSPTPPKAPSPAPAPAPEKKPGDAKKNEPHVSIVKQLEIQFGRERVMQMLSAFSVSFSVEMNSATLLRTNGYNHRDVVGTWETPLSRLVDKWPTITMEADFGLAAPPADTPAPEAKKP
jgi:hypothetical protein